MQGRTFAISSLVLAVAILLSLRTAATASFEYVCSKYALGPNPTEFPFPQWEVGADSNCTSPLAIGSPKNSSDSSVRDNVLGQINMFRALAGVPTVTTNPTRNEAAQEVAYWATQIPCGYMDCSHDNNTNCWTERREALWDNMVFKFSANQYALFDVQQYLEEVENGFMVLAPELGDIGIGVSGAEEGDDSWQTLFLRGNEQENLWNGTNTWFAYPGDGPAPLELFQYVNRWFFATLADSEPVEYGLQIYDLSDGSFVDGPQSNRQVRWGGWDWIIMNFNVPQKRAIPNLREGSEYEVQIISGNKLWTYRPKFANCSAIPFCGDGFCNGDEDESTCSLDCLQCGELPERLRSFPAKCENGTWIILSDVILMEDDRLEIGSTKINFTRSFRCSATSTVVIEATSTSQFGSIHASDCAFLDGLLVFNINFTLSSSVDYSFTLVTAVNDPCSQEALEVPTKRQSTTDGSRFSRVEVNFEQDGGCQIDSNEQRSSRSYGVLLQASSGCGSSDDVGLIAGLTIGLVVGALLLVMLLIAVGLAYAAWRKHQRKAALNQMQHQLRTTMDP